MAIRNLNKIHAADEGNTDYVFCPECNENVSMRLFSTQGTDKVALFKGVDRHISIAVCPECASVFTVSENYMKERRAGTTVFFTQSDLTLLRKNND